MMTPAQKLQAVSRLIDLAMPSVVALPAAERADLYEGIAVALGSLDVAMRDMATAAAEALREAEARQMTFTALLRAAAVCEPQPQHDTTTP